ncbi:MAG: WD40/YVTN/BNR-like repeat-containing protein [Gammaproteobacteria bacterium]
MDVETPVEETGIVLRGRNANRRFVWRVRDLVIEHSTDGGATWVTEHTADHSIRAGAFVDTNVAWLVGKNGLVLRRTINGWFGASPPAEGHLIAVRASSPSRATVTHDDGRVFTTENGGVTWSVP